MLDTDKIFVGYLRMLDEKLDINFEMLANDEETKLKLITLRKLFKNSHKKLLLSSNLSN